MIEIAHIKLISLFDLTVAASKEECRNNLLWQLSVKRE